MPGGGDGDEENNLLCVLSLLGGDKLGCVAPSQARLICGLQGTKG